MFSSDENQVSALSSASRLAAVSTATLSTEMHVAERRKMMQAWSDYLDALKDDAAVVPLFSRS